MCVPQIQQQHIKYLQYEQKGALTQLQAEAVALTYAQEIEAAKKLASAVEVQQEMLKASTTQVCCLNTWAWMKDLARTI